MMDVEYMEEQIKALVDEINDMTAMLSALKRMSTLANEIKWLSDKYGIDDISKDADEILTSSIKKMAVLREKIETYRAEVEGLRKKLKRMGVV